MKHFILKAYNKILINSQFYMITAEYIMFISLIVATILDRFYGISFVYFLPLIIGPHILYFSLLILGKYLEYK